MAVALFGLLVAALPALGASPLPTEGVPDRDNLFPRRQFQALPDKVVGVVVADGQDVLGREGRRGPTDALCFASGGGSYRWVYVPVTRKWIIGALNVLVGARGDRIQRFNHLNVASARNVQQWGVSGPYTLVEVEVNGGLGAPPSEKFVATNMRVVEGTKEYPLHIGKTVDDLRMQFHVYLKVHEDLIARGMSEARTALPEGHKLTPGREQTETVFVSWLPETDQLRVVFQARLGEKALATARPAAPPPPVTTQPDDGRPPPAPVHAGVLLGVDVGMTYDVSRRGVVDRSRPVPLHRFNKELLAVPAPSGTGEFDWTDAPGRPGAILGSVREAPSVPRSR
jgi:hypothetical protein